MSLFTHSLLAPADGYLALSRRRRLLKYIQLLPWYWDALCLGVDGAGQHGARCDGGFSRAPGLGLMAGTGWKLAGRGVKRGQRVMIFLYSFSTPWLAAQCSGLSPNSQTCSPNCPQHPYHTIVNSHYYLVITMLYHTTAPGNHDMMMTIQVR
ncbi:hypothetical protein DM02DRAFT_420914 [Periconia macrospinosa]|uniref:Uncharacterized protein n=1 Tax=Periconia macrospinosa TaxID=97972 RepID=A0A2V1CZ82_9PLEO|nr:hypothetical protein DM02DRAFT_420914 [Periconia macrospinosa]